MERISRPEHSDPSRATFLFGMLANLAHGVIRWWSLAISSLETREPLTMMRQSFQRKLGIMPHAKRPTEMLLLIPVLLCSAVTFFAGEMPLGAIKDIAPHTAQPGDLVKILLDRELGRYTATDVVVYFGRNPGETIAVRGMMVEVRVPGDLRPAKNIWVVVKAGNSTTLPYGNFEVLPPPPPTATLTAEPSTVRRGKSVTLSWKSDNATELAVAPGVGTVPASGSLSVIPSDSTSYTLTAKGLGGSVTATAHVTVEPPSLISPFLWIVIVCMGGGFVFLLLWWLRNFSRRRHAMQAEIQELRAALEKRKADVSPKPAAIIESEQESQPHEEAAPDLPVPDVPAELVEACLKGECVVFVGPELSRAAGLPTGKEFAQGLLQWAMESKILEPNLEISYRAAIQSGQVDLVADGVASAVQAGGDSASDLLLRHLQDVFGKSSAQPTQAHHLLRQIGFSGALTTNLDSLLEDALETPVFTPLDVQELLPMLAKRVPFVLKLFGTLERPETIQISPTRYRAAVDNNRVFLESVGKLFLSRTVLFIGTSMDGIQSNLQALQLGNVNRSHYALVGVSGPEWRAKAALFQENFSVQILPYSASEGDTTLLDFLGVLAKKVTQPSGAAKAAPRELPCLKRVQLTNIGPFEALDLRLDPKWNVLLGNNGVGKSNILKAIALGLCGKHAQKYADRLIKFREPSGQIRLEFSDGAANVTALRRTSAEPEVKVSWQRELLGTERWLAMGFPPLRQVDWTLPKGPEARPGTPYTTHYDILPLVAGDPDPRMNDLKQSIINLDYQTLSGRGERSKNLLDDFFDVVDQMTQGVTLRRGLIDPKTFQIFVETDDGKVPLAAVSQGTQSMMGWVGLLLLRLYEVYGDTDRPMEQPALVLIDEIDAHMHPAWQQTIVHHLSELFPKVQFVATTHSPLIVGGLDVRQVVRLARDPNRRVGRLPIEEDMTMGRADQVLTSSLFGLPSTLDKTTQEKISKIQVLAIKQGRTAEEDKMLQDLRHELTLRIPVNPEMPPERRAYELVNALLTQHVMDLLPTTDEARLESTKQELLAKARQLLNEVQKQQRVGG